MSALAESTHVTETNFVAGLDGNGSYALRRSDKFVLKEDSVAEVTARFFNLNIHELSSQSQHLRQ